MYNKQTDTRGKKHKYYKRRKFFTQKILPGAMYTSSCIRRIYDTIFHVRDATSKGGLRRGKIRSFSFYQYFTKSSRRFSKVKQREDDDAALPNFLKSAKNIPPLPPTRLLTRENTKSTKYYDEPLFDGKKKGVRKKNRI